MSTKGTNPLVVLRQGRDISVRRRHPWVFSGAIAEKKGTLQNGCLVEVRSKDGSLLGCGHWGTRGIAVRMLSFRESEDELLLIREKITSAINFRRAIGLLEDPQTTGFRLVHGEGDELPGLVIDLYGETAVVQGHSHGMWRLKESIDELLRAEQQLKIKQVVFRRVEAQLDLDEEGKQPEMLVPEPPQVVAFSENGLRFIADVTNGQKTGFF